MISSLISPLKQERFPKNPSRGVLVFTLVALMLELKFSKQCSYIASHEFMLSIYTLPTYHPNTLASMMTRELFDLVTGGKVIS